MQVFQDCMAKLVPARQTILSFVAARGDGDGDYDNQNFETYTMAFISSSRQINVASLPTKQKGHSQATV